MKIFKRNYMYFWLTGIFALGTIFSLFSGEFMNSLLYLGFTAIIGIINFLLYKTSYIKIDGNMVEGKVGIIKTQKLSSNKNNITSVKVDKGIIGRIFNFGTIYISSASSNYIFKFMNNPDEIKESILK